jgi:hypothetical protein
MGATIELGQRHGETPDEIVIDGQQVGHEAHSEQIGAMSGQGKIEPIPDYKYQALRFPQKSLRYSGRASGSEEDECSQEATAVPIHGTQRPRQLHDPWRRSAPSFTELAYAAIGGKIPGKAIRATLKRWQGHDKWFRMLVAIMNDAGAK